MFVTVLSAYLIAVSYHFIKKCRSRKKLKRPVSEMNKITEKVLIDTHSTINCHDCNSKTLTVHNEIDEML